MPSATTTRDELLEFVRRDLIGPTSGPNEVIDEPPNLRYFAGVLFPKELQHDESTAVSGTEDKENPQIDEDEVKEAEPQQSENQQKPAASTNSIDNNNDDDVTHANSYHPSVIGLSFMVASNAASLQVLVSAAIYENRKVEKTEERSAHTVHARIPLDLPQINIPLKTADGQLEKHPLTDSLSLYSVVREWTGGHRLVTLSALNESISGGSSSTTFYQAQITARSGTDEQQHCFMEYKTIDSSPQGEELSLEMLYRNRRSFAIGHGCSADWNASDIAFTDEVRTEVFPHVVIPPINPLSENQPYLDMAVLSDFNPKSHDVIPRELDKFAKSYEVWISSQEKLSSSLDKRFSDIAKQHIKLCQTTLLRIRSGIDLLRSEPVVLESFCLANRAMLMQQEHARRRRTIHDSWDPLPNWEDYRSDWNVKKGYWRSFQLAFILMTLPGIVDPEDSVEINEESIQSRDLVDLIWFPTGGGKTEAYLGVTAFVAFYNRLSGQARPGCLVLMRYTLRLLTSQQFQRASSLICACELIRRQYLPTDSRWGESPFKIGLWVGLSLTPNDEKDAKSKLSKLARDTRGEEKNPFQLLSCPWCGTELDNRDNLGYVDHKTRMIFLCPSKTFTKTDGCPFSRRGHELPVCVVDESIYKDPPTMIIGTVDKFAMLAWRKEAGSILKKGGGPELIIQDELHLISGPLGSMVGLYESVIDYMCTSDGHKPKIIASTATIREAAKQSKALYDRPMFQFPPAGLDADDSYFAVKGTNPDEGRCYAGLLPTGASSPITAQIRSVVAFQQGILIVGKGNETAIDPYWTLVQYFGSLKELGRAATFLTGDIPDFLPTMHRRYSLEKENKRYIDRYEELTSRRNEDEIPKIIKRLETRYQTHAQWDDQALDTVLATNMISVGMDIDRLGLMMIAHQPKGTSEYIQASSRVGRSARGPGLVFTLYNCSRPRDRSHCEQFRGYHEAFYRFVEPTSVTPFSPPAMERGLHALLVIAGRHICGWSKPTEL
ncbi:TPA: hypothetical protein EYN23_06540, partial [Candidatus Poribacteria bacterium]|nr:hypothetical protein [Candidatus Poribacteria bacterium]